MMIKFELARMTDTELKEIKELEDELGIVLIAYNRKEDVSSTVKYTGDSPL